MAGRAVDVVEHQPGEPRPRQAARVRARDDPTRLSPECRREEHPQRFSVPPLAPPVAGRAVNVVEHQPGEPRPRQAARVRARDDPTRLSPECNGQTFRFKIDEI